MWSGQSQTHSEEQEEKEEVEDKEEGEEQEEKEGVMKKKKGDPVDRCRNLSIFPPPSPYFSI